MPTATKEVNEKIRICTLRVRWISPGHFPRTPVPLLATNLRLLEVGDVLRQLLQLGLPRLQQVVLWLHGYGRYVVRVDRPTSPATGRQRLGLVKIQHLSHAVDGNHLVGGADL